MNNQEMTMKNSQEQEIAEFEICKKINFHVQNLINIEDKKFLASIHPSLLLNCDRFDLMAKYIYAKYRELGIDSDWGLRLYNEHIRLLNNYQEGDGSGKSGKNAFIDAFNNILDSIKANNFDEDVSVIPVGKGNLIIDGAHRTAACLLYDREVAGLFFDSVPMFENVPLIAYNYRFFRKKGMVNKWSDAMALEYCRLKKSTYIAVVFSSAVGKDEQIKQILQEYGCIYYEKSIYLVNEGPVNLIKQIYSTESWLGNWENKFSGARFKAAACFKHKGSTRIFLFDSDNLDKVKEAKSRIRELFGIGKHSVHINDTPEEAVHLAQLFFNENSIHFLNTARPQNYNKFYQLLKEYKEWLVEHHVDKECFCIDGGSVMGAYGIRKPGDFDVLHYGYDELLSANPNIDDSNHSKLPYHIKTKDDIIFNPENHFYYDGLKFASLDIIKTMKEKRGNPSDTKDIKLINAFLVKNTYSKTSLFYLYFQTANWLQLYTPKELVQKVFWKLKKWVKLALPCSF